MTYLPTCIASSVLMTCVFLGCETTTEIVNVKPHPVVLLAVGNIYVYNNSFADSSGVGYTDTYEGRIIEKTIIGSQVWYKFDAAVICRADTGRLYTYQDGFIVTEMDYSLAQGDGIRAGGILSRWLPMGQLLHVTSRRIEKVLGIPEEVFRLAGIGGRDSTEYELAYATHFGLIEDSRGNKQGTGTETLVAALVNGTFYGDSTYLFEMWSLGR